MELKFDEKGLIPVVAQDYKTNEVIMVAYMNEESLELTKKNGYMYYYSRSRQELWKKGETSGHFQEVVELKYDCDADTILAKVKQTGVGCHTGEFSCFYTEFKDYKKLEVPKKTDFQIIDDVFATIDDRAKNPKEGSYTNYLLEKGIDKILKKVGEEATEVVIGAKNADKDEIQYEVADLIYHLSVMLYDRGLNWEMISEELKKRYK